MLSWKTKTNTPEKRAKNEVTRPTSAAIQWFVYMWRHLPLLLEATTFKERASNLDVIQKGPRQRGRWNSIDFGSSALGRQNVWLSNEPKFVWFWKVKDIFLELFLPLNFPNVHASNLKTIQKWPTATRKMKCNRLWIFSAGSAISPAF